MARTLSRDPSRDNVLRVLGRSAPGFRTWGPDAQTSGLLARPQQPLFSDARRIIISRRPAGSGIAPRTHAYTRTTSPSPLVLRLSNAALNPEP